MMKGAPEIVSTKCSHYFKVLCRSRCGSADINDKGW